LNDEELIGYCEIHCKTERALFHIDHIRRMWKLANEPEIKFPFGEWFSMHEDMQYLCSKAKQIMDNKKLIVPYYPPGITK